jgi:hypothetical protein
MNHSIRVTRCPRRAWPSAARTAAPIIAAVTLILLAAACNSSPSSTGPGGSSNAGGTASSSSSSAVSYSHCMRSNGVPDYSDPGSGGNLPKGSAQQFGVSSSQLQAAEQACQHLLPAIGVSLNATSMQECHLAHVCPPALVQQALTAGLKFAQCMRSHGVPDWPDPTVDSEGEPLFSITVPRPPPPQGSVPRSTNASACSPQARSWHGGET